MREQDHILFEQLKQKIVAMMQQSYPGINPSISEWKGQEITDFQEELRMKVNANISEKWFYTHMKSSQESLPRIDMLNILSRYAGYANWDDFVHKNIQVPVALVNASRGRTGDSHANRYFLIVPVATLLVLFTIIGLYFLFNTREYRFSFLDADTHESIINAQTEIILLTEGESPAHYLAGNDGSFRIKTNKSKIMMVVKAPYYQVDTITRIVRKFNTEEVVMLKPDDYALMIHYFSMMKVDDWQNAVRNLIR